MSMKLFDKRPSRPHSLTVDDLQEKVIARVKGVINTLEKLPSSPRNETALSVLSALSSQLNDVIKLNETDKIEPLPSVPGR